MPLEHVVNIAVADDEVRKRLAKRAEIEGRAMMPTPKLFQNRIDTYKIKANRAFTHYRPAGIVRDIDGIGTIDDVFVKITAIFTK